MPKTKMDAQVDRCAGARWFERLERNEKWELGDQLVLGEFSWEDWAELLPAAHCPPSPAFLRGVDNERINWE